MMILNGYEIFSGEKLSTILDLYPFVKFSIMKEEEWKRHQNFSVQENFEEFISSLDWLLKIVIAKAKKKELGFVCLFNDDNGNYWYKVSRGIVTAVTETLNSLETLIEDIKKFEINSSSETKEKINLIYRKIKEIYEII